MKKILYITYDGLTDPLGQSQILPYLKGLTKYGYQFTILSFEKKERYQLERQLIEELTTADGIEWVPLQFTTQPPLLAKLYDAQRMKAKAFSLHRKQQFDMIHCRSYIAADIGLQMKQKFGVKFFFDMRGFWADEKKDGGSWNMSNPVFQQVYKYYKNKEKQYLNNADYVISLTEAGKKEMETWDYFNAKTPVQIIPCCTDFDHFSLTDNIQKTAAKENLGLTPGAFVLSYLGSVGTWYMLDEMLEFFKLLKQERPDANFLFITHSPASIIQKKCLDMNLNFNKDIIVRQASRKEVPLLAKASDVNISFIKPVFSKISSSPTKLGEILSMGIPVICNRGVGDVEQVVKQTASGVVLQDFSNNEYARAISIIPQLMQMEPIKIRNAAKEIYSLSRGVDLYADCYKAVI